MASPFDVLGIDPEADEAELVRAYREQVKEAHPDHGGSASEFRRVRRAYEEIRAGRSDDGTSDFDGSAGCAGAPGRDGDADRENVDGARRTDSRVEYLNFDVVADRGWQIDDGDLFEKAADEGLDPADHGRFLARSDEFLLEAAENRGFEWPYACRGGACANCAVAVVEGATEMPPNHVLPSELLDRGIRLSCVGTPVTDGMRVVYNVKRLPDLDELLLPARRFGQV